MWHILEMRGAYKILVGRRPEGIRPLVRIEIEGRIILKWISKKWDGEAWTRLIWLRIGTVPGICEFSNEPLGSVQCR
jgi:hypothetical protein